MKLNIHLMSHPVIQHLSNIIMDKPLKSYIDYQISRQLGLLITYETIRNWLTTYKLTIKQIKKQKEITIIDPKESYLIIINDIDSLSLLQEIKLLIPKSKLELIYNYDTNKNNKYRNKFKKLDSYTKIIMINNRIEVGYVVNILDYLTKNNNIKIHQIRLTCIRCETNQLIAISKEYAELNIYTTKIIDNSIT